MVENEPAWMTVQFEPTGPLARLKLSSTGVVGGVAGGSPEELGTTLVAAETAWALPAVLVAVTATSRVEPASAAGDGVGAVGGALDGVAVVAAAVAALPLVAEDGCRACRSRCRRSPAAVGRRRSVPVISGGCVLAGGWLGCGTTEVVVAGGLAAAGGVGGGDGDVEGRAGVGARDRVGVVGGALDGGAVVAAAVAALPLVAEDRCRRAGPAAGARL